MSQLPQNNEPSKISNPMAEYNANWISTFNSLCYELFFANPKGQQFLQMVEHKFFYAPVANPGKEFAWATFNEGRNEFIRSLRAGGQSFMNQKQAPQSTAEAPVKTKRTRKAK